MSSFQQKSNKHEKHQEIMAHLKEKKINRNYPWGRKGGGRLDGRSTRQRL